MDTTAQTVDLLQQLIRNGCVNDGTVTSGFETRNADLLESVLAGPRVDITRLEPVAGRANIIARIEGTDRSAPSLALMAHTDVVPATPSRWKQDPFGGELIEGEVWGRGAVDMLNLTSSMAVVFRALANDPTFTPRGTLLYIGVADEETGGDAGARWLVDNEPDAVRVDYMVSEFGGMKIPTSPPDAPALPVGIAEKGANWVKIRFRGTPGHGSVPYRTDNALVKAAEAVRRVSEWHSPAQITETWKQFVSGLGLPPGVAGALSDPGMVEQVIAALPDLGLARMVQACTHTTLAPTVMHAGVKTNVIPDSAAFEVDVRSLPGEGPEDVVAMLTEALGPDLTADAEIDVVVPGRATESPVDTPLWDVLSAAARKLVPGAVTLPMMLTGATDARFFRKLGTTCYGFGLFSERISFADFATMFHGDNERIDVDSLALTTQLWEHVARELLA